jgi:hypothetical protein
LGVINSVLFLRDEFMKGCCCTTAVCEYSIGTTTAMIAANISNTLFVYSLVSSFFLKVHETEA